MIYLKIHKLDKCFICILVMMLYPVEPIFYVMGNVTSIYGVVVGIIMCIMIMLKFVM